MRRNFWIATAISLGCYAGAIVAGFVVSFRLTLFLLVALQVTWTLFCVLRLIQLRLGGAHRHDAEPFERGDYAFALGGSVVSITLLAAIVVATQIV